MRLGERRRRLNFIALAAQACRLADYLIYFAGNDDHLGMRMRKTSFRKLSWE